MSDLAVSIEHAVPSSGKQEIQHNTVDPRRDTTNQQFYQTIIKEQYEYFKRYGKGQFLQLQSTPSTQQILPDGTQLYVPDRKKYYIPEKKFPVQSSSYEQSVQKSLQNMQESMRLIDRQIKNLCVKLFPEYHDFFKQVEQVLVQSAQTLSFDRPDDIKFSLKHIVLLNRYIALSEQIIKKTSAAENIDQSLIIQKVKSAFSNNPLMKEEEVDQVIDQVIKSRHSEEEKKQEVITKKNNEIAGQIREATSDLTQILNCIDIHSPNFLRVLEENSPFFLSLWLSKLDKDLKDIDFVGINNTINVLGNLLQQQNQQMFSFQEKVFSQINETIQSRQSTPQEETIDHNEDFNIDDYIWIPKEKYSEMMSRSSQSYEETLRKHYKDHNLSGLEWELQRMSRQKTYSEMIKQQKEEREYQVQPAMKLHEKKSPISSFREFDHERFENQTKGAIETIDQSLSHGTLFVNNRVDLGKNGYQALSESYKPVPVPVFSKDQQIDSKTSIIHFPCAQGIHVQLPVPRNYELVNIGFSAQKHVSNDLQKVSVSENTVDHTYTFTNVHGEGYVHYAIRQKSQPDMWSDEEQQKYKKTFESSFDRPDIKQMIQKAKTLKTVEEKTNFILQELSQMDFIYTERSNLLDNLYHEIGKDRFYALVENIGMGRCQLFSQTVGHIFRQVGIPSRIIEGEIYTQYAFSAAGHAKVEYADESGAVHEFEATAIVYDKSHRLKQSTQIDQETFTKLAQRAATTNNPEEFQQTCAAIKTMMIEETPSFERRIAELDEYVNRFNQQIAQGIQTEDDLYKLQKLGLEYDRFRFGFQEIKTTDSRYDLYEQYLKIQPLDQCEKYIFQSLTSQLLNNTLSENNLINITEQLMMNDYNGRLGTDEIDASFHQKYFAATAWQMLKNTSKDTTILARSEFILEKIAEFGTFITNFVGADLEQLIPLLQAVQPKNIESAKKSAVLRILLISVNATLSDNQKILLTENDLKKRQKVKDFFKTHLWIKDFISDPASWPEKPLDHQGFQHLVLGDTRIFNEKEKENLTYNMIKKYVPKFGLVNDVNDLCNAIHIIGLSDALIKAHPSQNRSETLRMIQEVIERDITTRLDSYSTVSFPFIQSKQEIEDFTPEHAELYLKAQFQQWELDFTSRQLLFLYANNYFLGVKDYFPKLSLSQELINQWNSKYEKDHTTKNLPELAYDMNGFTLLVHPIFNKNYSLGFDIFKPHFWSETAKIELFGEKYAGKITAIEKLCSPPREPTTTISFKKIANQNTAVKSIIKQFINTQQEAIADTALLQLFWSQTSQKILYDFLLLHDATVTNKPIPEALSEQVKDFYRLIPTDVITAWINSQNKILNSTDILLMGKTESETKTNLIFTEKLSSVITLKETRSIFHTLAEQTVLFITERVKHQIEHAFGNFKTMAPSLFAVLDDAENGGPEFRRKLTVIERTFRNHLNRAGEFVNLNYAFVKRGTEFTEFKPYQQGDDAAMIDQKVLARTDKLYVKKTSLEEEPRNNLCLVNLDNLVMKNQKEFEPHAQWEKIFTETYGKLFSLMLDSSQKNKPLETRLYFHGQEIFKSGLALFNSLPQQENQNRISIVRDAVAEIFAEINKFIPLLQQEYVMKETENTLMPYLKPRFLPNLRLPTSTNLIVLSNKHDVDTLAKIHEAAGSRVV